MTIWSTHLELADGCSLLKSLPPLDDLFDFEVDRPDFTVNWAENAPPFLMQDSEDEAEVDDDDDGFDMIDLQSMRPRNKYDDNISDWRREEEERWEDEMAADWMKEEMERRRLAAPKNLRWGLVKRTRSRLMSAKTERILNPGRHRRLRIGVYTLAAQMKTLRCNADFAAAVQRCLGAKKKPRLAA